MKAKSSHQVVFNAPEALDKNTILSQLLTIEIDDISENTLNTPPFAWHSGSQVSFCENLIVKAIATAWMADGFDGRYLARS